jgi:hypothetical protein
MFTSQSASTGHGKNFDDSVKSNEFNAALRAKMVVTGRISRKSHTKRMNVTLTCARDWARRDYCREGEDSEECITSRPEDVAIQLGITSERAITCSSVCRRNP